MSVAHGDTSSIAYGVGTYASRNAVVAGNAAFVSAQQVKQKALTLAAHLLEAAPADLELRDGGVQVGRHLPPSADSVPAFLARFEEAYNPARLSKIRQVIAVAASHHRFAWKGEAVLHDHGIALRDEGFGPAQFFVRGNAFAQLRQLRVDICVKIAVAPRPGAACW